MEQIWEVVPLPSTKPGRKRHAKVDSAEAAAVIGAAEVVAVSAGKE
jgi:hypothetical protein